jgi:pimeloyl-ACP methyl ester carboxylesterase
MMTQNRNRAARLAFVICAALIMSLAILFPANAVAATEFGRPPPDFTSGTASVTGTTLHYVRGGHGPAVILLHGFPEDWVEYRAIMPRLAKRFTVVAVDLPGIGGSAPSKSGYDASTLAGQIHVLADSLKLERPYLVGHDLGGIVSYAYVRRFPDTLRGAMILDVPVPGIAGWEQSTQGFWHIGFIQTPGQLAERLVDGRQAIFLGWCYDQGKFSPAERTYYVGRYGDSQIHAAFEIYRAFPKDGEWNALQTARNSTPLVVVAGEKSFFATHQQTFMDGYRARGMTQVQGAVIPGASHYVVADNPDGVADVIERYAAR